MPWVVGIDEAGYGPNLGPLVMTSVACRVPEKLATANLWRVLKTAVRRSSWEEDSRLLIDDSKLVYSTTRGLCALETGVAATLSVWPKDQPVTFQQLLSSLSPGHGAASRAEAWYTGTTLLPLELDQSELASADSRLQEVCQKKGIEWGLIRSEVVHASRFNSLIAEWNSKGAVLGHALQVLIQANLEVLGDAESVHFVIDKHGGRNCYAAILQNAVPDGFVGAEEECAKRSGYRVMGMDRDVRFAFQPRADSANFCVAIASMVSKYVREVFMIEFNRYWQERIPGLAATAGYPGDAARFFLAMRPVMRELGIAEERVWRKR